jgi:predicted glutamine amidotransferase
MCVILVCPKNVRPDRATLESCHRANPHGAGVAWREDGEVRWSKGLEPAELDRIVRTLPGEIVIHFRLASVGEVTSRQPPRRHRGRERPGGEP